MALVGVLSVAAAERDGSCHIEGCDVCFKISCEPRCVSNSPPEATGAADCFAEGGDTNDDTCIGKTTSFASPDSVSATSTSEGSNGVGGSGNSRSTADGGPGSVAHTETNVEISKGKSVASSSSIVVGTG
ncbi:hypothetical protein BSKO_04777 [Bryopsis sp. KO-2023]|nr:hypothetical protein BSKO_04777 [Bryopsis sp. KO-2023]